MQAASHLQSPHLCVVDQIIDVTIHNADLTDLEQEISRDTDPRLGQGGARCAGILEGDIRASVMTFSVQSETAKQSLQELEAQLEPARLGALKIEEKLAIEKRCGELMEQLTEKCLELEAEHQLEEWSGDQLQETESFLARVGAAANTIDDVLERCAVDVVRMSDIKIWQKALKERFEDMKTRFAEVKEHGDVFEEIQIRFKNPDGKISSWRFECPDYDACLWVCCY